MGEQMNKAKKKRKTRPLNDGIYIETDKTYGDPFVCLDRYWLRTPAEARLVARWLYRAADWLEEQKK
jgi:hypothetical protein